MVWLCAYSWIYFNPLSLIVSKQNQEGPLCCGAGAGRAQASSKDIPRTASWRAPRPKREAEWGFRFSLSSRTCRFLLKPLLRPPPLKNLI